MCCSHSIASGKLRLFLLRNHDLQLEIAASNFWIPTIFDSPIHEIHIYKSGMLFSCFLLSHCNNLEEAPRVCFLSTFFVTEIKDNSIVIFCRVLGESFIWFHIRSAVSHQRKM
ncbi:unnamed protein product, partial [Vitis vinifera]|uniref:Uncharacterized protein n=1 Tax=Vitis vinifera TaxID=29760 RepID=D7U760_VITVI